MTKLIKHCSLLALMLICFCAQLIKSEQSNSFNITMIQDIYHRERESVVNTTYNLLNLFFNDVENGIDQVIKSSPLDRIQDTASSLTSDAILYLKGEVSKKLNESAAAAENQIFQNVVTTLTGAMVAMSAYTYIF
eukprot:403342036